MSKRRVPGWKVLMSGKSGRPATENRRAAAVASCALGLFVLGLMSAGPARAGSVGRWLALGPVPAPLPAWHDEGEKKVDAKSLLDARMIDRQNVEARAGIEMALPGGRATWVELPAGKSGVALDAGAGTSPSVAWLSTHVHVGRFMKVQISAEGSHPWRLYVDGKSQVDAPTGGEKSSDLSLIPGSHRVLVKTVFAPSDTNTGWTFTASVEGADSTLGDPVVTIDPHRPMNLGDVLDAPSVRGLGVSSDGNLVVMTVSMRRPPEGKTESWVEVRRVRDGSLIRSLRDFDASALRWIPGSHRISYVVRSDGAATLRSLDIDGGRTETLLRGIKDFSRYLWSRDGSFVVYTVTKKPDKSDEKVTRLRGISDRRTGDRNRSVVYVAAVPEGVIRRITAGLDDVALHDVHPDGKHLLLSRSREDLGDRGYTMDELVILDLTDNAIETIHESRWLGRAQFSPDGEKILVGGGPSCFGKLGWNVPSGVIPNDYDGQLYLFDPASRVVEPITRDFDPAVRSAWWPAPGSNLYVIAGQGEYVRLFRYAVSKKEFEPIAVPGCDAIARWGAASGRDVAVVSGTSANEPVQVYSVDLRRGRAKRMVSPAEARFATVERSRVEDFDFETGDGTKIVGRVHYPPDFDAAKNWPCIVYYYGGTSPVTRSFGGRYPKNLWAAHGYIVYVLQPSGATGFGQEFSARHVNDWGKRVSGEIIEGTRAFLKAHSFVDPQKVGCIGASFGGFMTELLVTKTDMFAAAVSHAGISSISSYWGEGYWGYGYNAVSAANSFPWNRPDIYVDQSPLFAADKVNTPLLLLHGSSDHNVPPGESEQFYTALKLLGKDVEYIRVKGEDHWILNYGKRVVWSNAIVAWFDRWLKGEPEWWNDMYPPIGGSLGEGGDAE